MWRFVSLILLFAGSARAAELPDLFPVPADVRFDALEGESWGEASFRIDEDVNLQRGRHWRFVLAVPNLAEDTAGAAIWAVLEPSLTRNGWSVVRRYDASPLSLTLRRKKDRGEAWAFISLLQHDDVRTEVVEITPQPMSLRLKAPAKTPEDLKADGADFPYLAPLPGSTFAGGEHVDTPMVVPVDADAEHFEAVASGAFRRSYQGPEGLSNIQAVTVYRDALAATGWQVRHVGQEINRADYLLVAQYTKDGRDIWATVSGGAGEYVINVADIGIVELTKTLERECRVALVGVLFEFKKATLQPASTAILTRARDALLAKPGVEFEVEGHTDNVGDDGYNVRLSEQRAQAVVDWLVKNGVPAARLTAKGYGKTRPCADNESPEGRASNRRVEVACRR